MDINMILGAVLLAVFIVVGIALAVLLFELVKFIKRATTTVNNLDPTLKNVETMTTDAVPAVAKIDPLMDRVQLTVDSLNLEMMRIDQILEDLTEITDAASSATAAVETVTNAPISAVNNVAARGKGAIGSKSASRESVDLADQRDAVAKALEEYKAAEAKDAAARSERQAQPQKPAADPAPVAPEAAAEPVAPEVEAEPQTEAPAEEAPAPELDQAAAEDEQATA